MLRNYLAAALRNLARNWLYSAISVTGLAIGLCAALLAGLVIRNELSYDRFIPGYEHVYLVMSELTSAGRPPNFSAGTHHGVAALLQLNFPQIAAVARLTPQEVKVKHGEFEAREKIHWADPNLFEVLPLPALAGDLKAALRTPNGIVLTRSVARKYFGHETPIGATLLLDLSRPVTVKAVLEDLPLNGTQLESGIFASGLASHSQLMLLGRDPPNPNDKGFGIDVRTYFRMTPGASTAVLGKAIPQLLEKHMPAMPPGMGYSMPIVRIDKVHLFPGLNPGIGGRLVMMGAVGALTLSSLVSTLSTYSPRARRAAPGKSVCARQPAPAAAR